MSKRPNLIFVFADQLRHSSCGFAGDARARTPRIDRLAGEGVGFSQAISGHPVCAPYRASLLTGKYTSGTGMVINELRLSPDHECFGHILKRAGYRTAYIGKWHLWANELGHHDETRNAFIPPGPHRLGFDGFWAAFNFHHTYHGAYYFGDTPERISVPGYEPDGQTELAIQWLEEACRGEEPFTLFLSYGTPHDPWNDGNVPAEYLAMFREADFPLPPNYSPVNDPHGDAWAKISEADRKKISDWMRVYYAMTANLDWNLGRLIDALAAEGSAQDTIFVFTSDHGECFGAHGRRGKNIFYEESIRVPFLVRWPDRLRAGATTNTLLNSPDIMPTLLGLMDLPIPGEVEGVDLSRSCLGEPGPEPEAAFLQGMGTTAAWADGNEWRAVRTLTHTYAVFRSDGMELLFDNARDPFQMKNLLEGTRNPETEAEPPRTEERALRDRLRAVMDTRMARLGDTFESCTWYRDHWTRDRNITLPRRTPPSGYRAS